MQEKRSLGIGDILFVAGVIIIVLTAVAGCVLFIGIPLGAELWKEFLLPWFNYIFNKSF